MTRFVRLRFPDGGDIAVNVALIHRVTSIVAGECRLFVETAGESQVITVAGTLQGVMDQLNGVESPAAQEAT